MSEDNIIIIGSGPAGLTSAIYAARANLKPILITGNQPGGQLTITSEVENYPGFPDGILGPNLMELFRKQAEKFGTEIINDEVTKVNFSVQPFNIKTGKTERWAKSIIIATGASSLWLGLPREQEFVGHGVSSCATCDGFFFKNKQVIVVGGGDSAMEEALYLTKFVTSVTVIHRGSSLRASKIMQDRATSNPKISFLWNQVVTELVGTGNLSGVVLKDVTTNQTKEIKIDGLFVAIGHKPNTEIFINNLELDQKGYIVTRNLTQTSVEGVFVAGDVHDHRYRQAVTAAGFGCMAAMDAEKWLNHK